MLEFAGMMFQLIVPLAAVAIIWLAALSVLFYGPGLMRRQKEILRRLEELERRTPPSV